MIDYEVPKYNIGMDNYVKAHIFSSSHNIWTLATHQQSACLQHQLFFQDVIFIKSRVDKLTVLLVNDFTLLVTT